MIFFHPCRFRQTACPSIQTGSRPPAGLLLSAVGLLAAVGVLAGCSFSESGKSASSAVQTEVLQPLFEVFPEEADGAAERFFPPSSSVQHTSRPRIAIIIDDIGYSRSIVRDLLALNVPLTFSVLPGSPYAETSARDIHEQKREIMLHLPMEPQEYPDIDPGADAMLVEMSSDRMMLVLQKNLNAVPFIQGVNNHMGSEMTRMPALMFRILSFIKARQLYFIDSVTSPDSICSAVARSIQIPFAQRDIFLDHIQSPESIRKQIRRLADAAELYGEAVGIGHPHEVTLQILKETLPDLLERVELVPVSQLVHTVG